MRASGEPGKLRFHLFANIPRTFEAQATPLAMPSGRGVVAIFHDITGPSNAWNKVRKDFLANVSHELRTPLAGIIGYSDTLLDGALDDTANRRKFVEIIRANAVPPEQHLPAADLLSAFRTGIRSRSPKPKPVSVRGVLEDGLLTVEAEARERGVRLIREEMQDLRRSRQPPSLWNKPS